MTIFVLKTRFIPFWNHSYRESAIPRDESARNKQFSNKYLYVEQLVFRPETRHK